MLARIKTFFHRYPDLWFFPALLLLALVVFSYMGMMGCSQCLDITVKDNPAAFSTQGTLAMGKLSGDKAPTATMHSEYTYYLPKERVRLNLKGDWTSDGPGALVWTPPAGASNFVFGSTQPEPGGPPFVFKNITKAQADFSVDYTTPETTENGQCTNYLEVQADDGGRTASTLVHWLGEAPDASIVKASVSNAPEAPAQAEAAAAETISLWQAINLQTVNTEWSAPACQELVDNLQSSNLIYAWRVPAAVSADPLTSTELPLYNGPLRQSKITLDYNWDGIIVPLQFRVDATQWANENLPSAEGEVWLALGGDPDASVDCTKIIGKRDSWQSFITLYFNLTGETNDCAGCALTSYTCYRTGAQDDEFTCLGPNALRVPATGDQWFFESVTPTRAGVSGSPLRTDFTLWNSSDQALTFDLSLQHNLTGATWNVYPGQAGDPAQPDTDHPIGAQFTVPANSDYYLYAITNSVPASLSGVYQVNLTVSTDTLPTSMIGTSNLIINELPEMASLDPVVGILGAADNDQVQAGAPLTFLLTVTNDGAVPLHDLVVTGPVPDNTVYQSCAGGDSCSQDNGSVTWNLANLGTGLSHVFVLQLQSGAGLAEGTAITQNNYSVQTGEGVSANGAPVTVHIIDPHFLIYLPMTRK